MYVCLRAEPTAKDVIAKPRPDKNGFSVVAADGGGAKPRARFVIARATRNIVSSRSRELSRESLKAYSTLCSSIALPSASYSTAAMLERPLVLLHFVVITI